MFIYIYISRVNLLASHRRTEAILPVQVHSRVLVKYHAEREMVLASHPLLFVSCVCVRDLFLFLHRRTKVTLPVQELCVGLV